MSDTATLAKPVFPRVIDATMRSDWRSCPHKFFRRHVQGLAKPSTNVHLHFGAAVASGLEAARRVYCAGNSADVSMLAGCQALIAAWGSYEPVARTRSEANKTLENALGALTAYFHEWPLDEDPVQIHRHAGEPCVEFSFALPIPGSRHPDTGELMLYCGRFDFIGDYDAAVWGVDDKTTSSSPNNDYWRTQWKLRGQFSGYCWGAREYGMPIKGFIVRGMGVKTASVECGWALAPRPTWMVDQWLLQLQDDVAQMATQYEALVGTAHFTDKPLGHAFPQAFADACSDFGGCAFLDLCSEQYPDTWLDDYVVSRWNPLERQGST